MTTDGLWCDAEKVDFGFTLHRGILPRCGVTPLVAAPARFAIE